MDFNEVYIAGSHQWERLKERTNEDDIYSLARNGKVVLMNERSKYIKNGEFVLPVARDGNLNIIRTVLNKKMEIHEY